MIQERDLIWLEENKTIFLNIRMTREQIENLFRIYNEITGESKGVTTCGRCIANVKGRVKVQFDKQINIY